MICPQALQAAVNTLREHRGVQIRPVEPRSVTALAEKMVARATARDGPPDQLFAFEVTLCRVYAIEPGIKGAAEHALDRLQIGPLVAYLRAAKTEHRYFQTCPTKVRFFYRFTHDCLRPLPKNSSEHNKKFS